MEKVIYVEINKPYKVSPILSDKSAFLKFDYKEEIVNYLKTLHNRNWNPKLKEWEIEESQLLSFIKKFPDYKFKICNKLKNQEIKLSKDIPNNYTEFNKINPYPFQKEGIHIGINKPELLLADSCGLGKSLSAYHISNINTNKKILIIVCSAALKYNWKKEINKLSDINKCYVLGEETKKGTVKDKIEDIKDIITLDSPYKYFITNKELFSKSEEAVKLIIDKINQGIIEQIIIDEAHLGFTNPKNNIAKAVLKMDPKYKMLITGTPMKNVPTDFYCYLKWFKVINTDYWHFEKEVTIKNKWGNVVEYVHPEKIAEKIQPYMLRRKKEEVLSELPEKTIEDTIIEMSDEHKKLYLQIIHDIVYTKNGKENKKEEYVNDSDTILGEIMNAQKCVSLPKWCDENFDIKYDNKLKHIEELLDNIVKEGNKAIIFSHFTHTTRFYKEHFSKYNPAYITGELSDKEKSAQEDKLNNDDTCKLCIISQAGGQGLNLIAASYLIMIDYPWTMSNYQQITDRIHRIGQKNNVTIYNLIYKDTIDEQAISLINNKGDLSDCMIEGSEKIDTKKLLSALKNIMEKQLIKKNSKSRFSEKGNKNG